ncbi:Endoribonuclease YbeY [Porphyridium purpureum]|uniref:Endoribonuclease YbeY n=1 Tax=Porphyridium purpureum TaxID=35688 RepID=A0A5J4YYJ4_PORPP|nr:Endoribonuclease YbeY [Porphyridium purpureum]|eukprot:POR4618..scf208_2
MWNRFQDKESVRGWVDEGSGIDGSMAQRMPAFTAPAAMRTAHGQRAVTSACKNGKVQRECAASGLGETVGCHENVRVSAQGVLLSAVQAARIEQDSRRLLRAARQRGVELSLLVCDDEVMRDLNARYRNVDRTTDVLSFPMDGSVDSDANDDHDTNTGDTDKHSSEVPAVLLGDLVISDAKVHEQAAERGHPYRSEFRILLVHGLLHLLGYDHELGDAEYEEMAAAEAELLSRLHWPGYGLIALSERLIGDTATLR